MKHGEYGGMQRHGDRVGCLLNMFNGHRVRLLLTKMEFDGGESGVGVLYFNSSGTLTTFVKDTCR